MPPSLEALLALPTDELQQRAAAAGVGAPPGRHPWRDGLVAAVLARETGEAHGVGVLEVHGEGFGFLRSPADDLLPGKDDIYVSQSQIKRFDLRTGDTVIGRVRPPKEGERYPALLRVDVVNGDPPDTRVESFEHLTAVHPSARLPLARDPRLAAIDWVAPLGLGARGLVVAPPRAPRTEVLRRLAALLATDDRFAVTVLLTGERPEEVTAWREEVPAEVIATPMEEAGARHVHVADIVFERARRLAERGDAVVLVVDSLTRLLDHASASGAGDGEVPEGVTVGALHKLRTWLATARDLREAGSVTLVAAVDDDEEASGRRVRRELLDAATWLCTLRDASTPTVNVLASWTRHEERLVPADELAERRAWREAVQADPASEGERIAALVRVPELGRAKARA
jgi:transcription termination factor Rho